MTSFKMQRLYFPILISAITIWITLNAAWFANSTVDPSLDASDHMQAAVKVFLDIKYYFKAIYSPFIFACTIPFFAVLGLNRWPYFAVESFFAIALIMGIWKTSRHLFDDKTAFICALLGLSAIKLNAGVRNYYLDYPLATIFIWQYYCWLKSRKFTIFSWSLGFTLLLVAGMWTKMAFAPQYCGLFLIWCAISIGKDALKEKGGGDAVRKACIPPLLCCTIYLIYPSAKVFLLIFGLNGIALIVKSDAFKNTMSAAFLRFAGFSCAGLALGAADYLLRTQFIAIAKRDNVSLQVKSLEEFIIATVNYFSFLFEYDLGPALTWFFIIGSSLVIFSCFKRESALFKAELGEMLFSIIIPSTVLVLYPTLAIARYFMPIYGFEIIIAGFWLTKKHWLPYLAAVPLALQAIFVTGWLINIPCTQISNYGIAGTNDPHHNKFASISQSLSYLAKQAFTPAANNVFLTSPPVRLKWTDAMHDFIDTLPPQTTERRTLALYFPDNYPYDSEHIGSEMERYLYCKKLFHFALPLHNPAEFERLRNERNVNVIVGLPHTKEGIKNNTAITSIPFLKDNMKIKGSFYDDKSYENAVDLLFFTPSAQKLAPSERRAPDAAYIQGFQPEDNAAHEPRALYPPDITR
ncbi:MAG: glycosyltransferase family 39 protein [bacterium]|nr:glycosyltransferase family 39 protein [bacterium]